MKENPPGEALGLLDTPHSRIKGLVRVFSCELDEEVELEADLLHPVIKGGDSKRYCLTRTNRLIVFRYANGALIAELELKKRWPLTWHYLNVNREAFEAREDGVMKGERWFGYGRTRALEVTALPKLFTPDLASAASFSFDPTGELFFTGGVAGGYGILIQPPYRPEFVSGLLNSRLLDFFHHRITRQMRGGWFSYESRFIRQLPIRPINFGVASERAEHDTLVGLVERVLAARRTDPTADTTALEREIDARVDRLCGLTAEEIKIVEEEGK